VVTAPERIRGIYASWPECRAVVKGVSGARYQAVASREQAQAMLRGEGKEVPSGLYGFVDGNHLGGVGVVIVERREGEDPTVVDEIGMTVVQVFLGAGLPSLGSKKAIQTALGKLRNILAELAALYLALTLVPEGSTVTVVHDYEGVGAWMEGRWKAKDAVVRFEKTLLELGAADPEDFERIQQRVRQEIDVAVDEAERSPMPRPEEAAMGLFAGDGFWEHP